MSDVTKFEGNLEVDAGYVLAVGSPRRKVAGGAAVVSGASTIAHGLASVPDFAQVTASVSGHIATITDMDDTKITIDIYDTSGAQVTTAETVYWLAVGEASGS